MHDWIIPDWPPSNTVKAISTTRSGGVSKNSYQSLNLGLYVNDDLTNVLQNRQILKSKLLLKAEPFWLKQVHSNKVLPTNKIVRNESAADAAISFKRDEVCAVLTADCLPVLFTNAKGDTVAAAHAGWRGLYKGILENTVAAFNDKPQDIYAWLGPAIGPESFEVGAEVREAFVEDLAECSKAFIPETSGKWLADIYQLAKLRLKRAGLTKIYGGGFDTMTDSKFFSYRNNPESGRMASLIWIDKS